jgi:hypothetical protein
MMLNNHIPLDFGISIKFLLDLRKLPVATRLDLRSTPKLLDLDFWSLSSLEMETLL